MQLPFDENRLHFSSSTLSHELKSAKGANNTKDLRNRINLVAEIFRSCRYFCKKREKYRLISRINYIIPFSRSHLA